MLYLSTPYRDAYYINARGEIARANSNPGARVTYSSGWLFLGLKHVKQNEFIAIEDLTPERISSLDLWYKNGNPQYTVRDLDHGTIREWGNTTHHGVKLIGHIDNIELPERVNGLTLYQRAHRAGAQVTSIYVAGIAWAGYDANTSYPITRGDLDKIGEFTRENVLKWVKSNAGDFESLTYFKTEYQGRVLEWNNSGAY